MGEESFGALSPLNGVVRQRWLLITNKINLMRWENHLDGKKRKFTLCGAPVTHFFDDPLYSSLLGTTHLAVVRIRGKIDGLYMMVALGVLEGEGCLAEIKESDGPATTELLPALMEFCDPACEIHAAAWVGYFGKLPHPNFDGGSAPSWIGAGRHGVIFPSNPGRSQNSPIYSVTSSALLQKCVADWGRVSWADMDPHIEQLCAGPGVAKQCGGLETCTIADLNTLEQIYACLRCNYYAGCMVLQWSAEEYFSADFALGLASGLIFQTVAQAGVFQVADPIRFIYVRISPEGMLSMLLATKHSVAHNSWVVLAELDNEYAHDEQVVWGGVCVYLKSFDTNNYTNNCINILNGCKLVSNKLGGDDAAVPCDMIAAGVILRILKQGELAGEA